MNLSALLQNTYSEYQGWSLLQGCCLAFKWFIYVAHFKVASHSPIHKHSNAELPCKVLA